MDKTNISYWTKVCRKYNLFLCNPYFFFSVSEKSLLKHTTAIPAHGVVSLSPACTEFQHSFWTSVSPTGPVHSLNSHPARSSSFFPEATALAAAGRGACTDAQWLLDKRSHRLPDPTDPSSPRISTLILLLRLMRKNIICVPNGSAAN